MNLREVGVVHEVESAPVERQSEVVGGVFAYASDDDVALCALQACLLAGYIELLAVSLIETAPDEDVEVEEALAEHQVSAHLAVVAYSGTHLEAIDVDALFGDDVDHGSECHAAIERRGRSAQHFYLLDFLERDAEVGGGSVSGVAVQPVAVDHEEHLLLSLAIDAAHGDVDVVVAVNVGHAGHVGNEHLLEVAGSADAYHVVGNEQHGHGRLVEALSLAGSGGDGVGHAILHVCHHVEEALRVFRRWGEIGVFREQLADVSLCLVVFVEGDVAEYEQPVGTLQQVTLEVAQVLLQQTARVVKTADDVVVLGLRIEAALLVGRLC